MANTTQKKKRKITNMNSLNLKQTDGDVLIKQGDFGSRLAYELQDEKHNRISNLDGKSAVIRLVDNDLNIIYEKDAIVEDSIVAFNIDKVLSNGNYAIEIKVDDYIFPSDDSVSLIITKSSEKYVDEKLVPFDYKTLQADIAELKGSKQETVRRGPSSYTLDRTSTPWTLWFDNGVGLQFPNNESASYSYGRSLYGYEGSFPTGPGQQILAMSMGEATKDDMIYAASNGSIMIEWEEDIKIINPIYENEIEIETDFLAYIYGEQEHYFNKYRTAIRTLYQTGAITKEEVKALNDATRLKKEN